MCEASTSTTSWMVEIQQGCEVNPLIAIWYVPILSTGTPILSTPILSTPVWSIPIWSTVTFKLINGAYPLNVEGLQQEDKPYCWDSSS